MTWETDRLLSSIKSEVITEADLVRYADASGDRNPIHLDNSFAASAGFPSVIVHGMFSMAFLGELILKNFPPSEFQIKRFQTKFKKVLFPGDRLTAEGKVTEVKDGKIGISVIALNSKGETIVEGEATLSKA